MANSLYFRWYIWLDLRFIYVVFYKKHLSLKRWRLKALAQEMPVVSVIKNHKQACLITAALTWSLSTAIVVTIFDDAVSLLKGSTK